MPFFRKKLDIPNVLDTPDIPDIPPSYNELQASAAHPQDQKPLYLSTLGPNEYPDEKKPQQLGGQGPNQSFQDQNGTFPNQGPNFSDGSSPNYGNGNSGNRMPCHPPGNFAPPPGNFAPPPGNYGPPPVNYAVPPNSHAVPLQMTNIAYDTEGTVTRPGYKEYLQRDKELVAEGDIPRPRSDFRHGAPLAPSRKGGKSSGGFPGAKGVTYFNTSEKK